MKKITTGWILTAVFFFVGGQVAHAAEHYIRSDATGAGNGNDWIDAWTALPSTLTRGDTYYIADGTYGSYNFDDGGSGPQLITIKKATATDHGTETGWSGSFGDESAIFTGGISVTTDYYLIDGVIDYGIEAVLPARTCGYTGIRMTGSFNTVRHVKASAPGDDWAGIGGYISGDSNTLSHCSLEQVPNDGMKLIGNNHVIEYTQIGPKTSGVANECCSGNVCHGDGIEIWATENIIYRYNRMFYNGDGIHFGIGATFSNNWDIHGNIFATGAGTKIRVNSAAPEQGTIRVYNNTFYDLYGGVNLPTDSQNNVFYLVENYIPSGTTNVESTVNPFVDPDNGNFHLNVDSASELIDQGSVLGGTYAADMDGNARGADGFWDIGAYEYVEPDPTPPIAPGGLSVF